MGRRTTRGGIYAREKSLIINFKWREQRFRETLRLEPTPANLKYARRMRDEIERKIEIGTFNFAEYFPDSKTLKKLGLLAQKIPTFSEMAERWLASARHLTKGTLAKYNQDLKRVWFPEIGHMLISDISYSRLASAIGKIDWNTSKTRNNALIPVRRIFDMAFLDETITKNPARNVKNAKVQKPKPDPFELEEVELILNYMEKRYPEQILNYFEFAFFTGMRPSEMISLQWGDIDFRRGSAQVQRAKVLQEIQPTKTHQVRDVELNNRALTALNRQKAHTFLASPSIFHNPVTGQPYHDERPQRRAYWHPALKALGLRKRRAYQTRHTFATLNLMAGANPMWVARQLGHNSMQMLLTVYSKWIDAADRSKEKNKLEKFMEEDQAEENQNQAKFSHKVVTKYPFLNINYLKSNS